MPFWSLKALVREEGDYRLHHGANGAWLSATDKGLIGQARTLWFYAYLYDAGYGTEAHLRAAEH